MKTNHGKMFAICRGGTHHFRLPVAQAHDHPIVHIPLNPTTRNIGEEVSEEGTQKICKYFISVHIHMLDLDHPDYRGWAALHAQRCPLT